MFSQKNHHRLRLRLSFFLFFLFLLQLFALVTGTPALSREPVFLARLTKKEENQSVALHTGTQRCQNKYEILKQTLTSPERRPGERSHPNNMKTQTNTQQQSANVQFVFV